MQWNLTRVVCSGQIVHELVCDFIVCRAPLALHFFTHLHAEVAQPFAAAAAANVAPPAWALPAFPTPCSPRALVATLIARHLAMGTSSSFQVGPCIDSIICNVLHVLVTDSTRCLHR